jgi:hypothetical protein
MRFSGRKRRRRRRSQGELKKLERNADRSGIMLTHRMPLFFLIAAVYHVSTCMSNLICRKKGEHEKKKISQRRSFDSFFLHQTFIL